MRVQHVFASCGDCGQSRVKEDARAMDGRGRERERADGRTDERTNRATKSRPVEWEMDAALKAKEKANTAMGEGAAAFFRLGDGSRERARAKGH